MRRRSWPAYLVVLLLLAASGCKRLAETVPVHGTMLYRGQPLPARVVVFVSDPQRHSRDVLAIARVESDGYFAVQWEDQDGLPPGW